MLLPTLGEKFMGDGGVKFIIGFAMLMRGANPFKGRSSSSSDGREILPLTTFPSSIAALASLRRLSFLRSSSMFALGRPLSFAGSSSNVTLPPRL